MTAPVNQLWQQITTLLQEHAPATSRAIRPAGPAEEIRGLERVVGLSLPADLVDWWTLTDGVDDRHDQQAGTLVPNRFVPLSASRAREEYQRLSESTATDPTCCGPDQTHQNQAGDDGSPFCSALVPISTDGTGAALCVDLRSGDDHGMIMIMAPGDGFSATHWGSVTDMLTEIAERLDSYAHGTELPYGEKHPTVTTEGMLHWP
ncbi:SMI1/KNR4 family protein [Amycolatopsis sp. WAC 04169]|uniref:SMI1/KNR4 family protein n=1 Tax=Amycolatopsis sp. WAC 04169 TaxID=2203197 RepID=UPI000F780254|nr:SMI1/KNR4 family protein [Amycolatopsis sp. WAC 04169]RSN31393.1 SMI1/KNR4 family protein [Amycolatopsis sp. WAC 04169]